MDKFKIRQDSVRSVVATSNIPSDILDRLHLFTIIQLLINSHRTLKSNYMRFSTLSEDEINLRMKSVLLQIIDSSKVLQKFIIDVVRSESCVSYDGDSLNVSPDLIFKLLINGVKISLIVEAKIISRIENKNVGQYCAKGINKFITGLYGWQQSEAIMIAYIRDSINLCSTLNRYFTSGTPPRREKYNVTSLAIPCDEFDKDVSCSVHDRKFRYIIKPFNKAGPIDIWHVGLS